MKKMIKKYLIVVQRWASKGAGESRSTSRGAAFDEEGATFDVQMVAIAAFDNNGIRESFGRRSAIRHLRPGVRLQRGSTTTRSASATFDDNAFGFSDVRRQRICLQQHSATMHSTSAAFDDNAFSFNDVRGI
uniref:Uncharacterized protein n=1 Tax=Cucumis melo TaxID=3656 RepID=A0A9I9DYZ4_CUCME